MSRITIAKGLRELGSGVGASNRQRSPGGGRKRAEDRDPGLAAALERIGHFMREYHRKYQALIVMDDTDIRLNRDVTMAHASFFSGLPASGSPPTRGSGRASRWPTSTRST